MLSSNKRKETIDMYNNWNKPAESYAENKSSLGRSCTIFLRFCNIFEMTQFRNKGQMSSDKN